MWLNKSIFGTSKTATRFMFILHKSISFQLIVHTPNILKYIEPFTTVKKSHCTEDTRVPLPCVISCFILPHFFVNFLMYWRKWNDLSVQMAATSFLWGEYFMIGFCILIIIMFPSTLSYSFGERLRFSLCYLSLVHTVSRGARYTHGMKDN